MVGRVGRTTGPACCLLGHCWPFCQLAHPVVRDGAQGQVQSLRKAARLTARP